ncbi:MAG: BolA/IbaG family iron-sulfur metabolism protein [Buchnera aphidicola (Nurudea yanoniella)]
MITEIIKNSLKSKFNVKTVKVFNESKKHTLIHKNYSHFKIIIVSNDFLKYNLLNRHRKIYYVLSSYISKYKIHGLALHTYTLDEWKNKFKKCLTSPICEKNNTN